MFGLLVLLVIAALVALSARYGVDSREGSADPNRSDYPVGIN